MLEILAFMGRLDVIIVIIYLAVMTLIGLFGGKDVKDADSFSGGKIKCGTFIIFAALSSSYIGGGYSAGNAAEGFSNGISMTFALFGFSISMLLTGLFLVSGIKNYPKASSVGGIIGEKYGKTAHVLTGFFSFICSAGMIGAQMGAIGAVFHNILGIDPRLGAVIGCSIVFLYSTTGGLKSIIIADVIQFCMLSVGIPLLLFMGLHKAGGLSAVIKGVPPSYLSPLNGKTLTGFLSLFLIMMFGEALAPPYTQRLLIGKNLKKTSRATILSSFFSVPFFIMTGLIGMISYVLGSTSDPASAMPSLIQQVLPIGIRGIVMAAMISIILSAADGFLNSASVSLVNDCVKIIKPEISQKKQLYMLRVVNLLTGVLALVLAFTLPNIFEILVLTYSFWCPLILIPLAAALLGVRSNSIAFRYALLSGLISTLIWNYVLKSPFDIDGAIVGMLFNLIVFTWKTRKFQKHLRKSITLLS